VNTIPRLKVTVKIGASGFLPVLCQKCSGSRVAPAKDGAPVEQLCQGNFRRLSRQIGILDKQGFTEAEQDRDGEGVQVVNAASGKGFEGEFYPSRKQGRRQ